MGVMDTQIAIMLTAFRWDLSGRQTQDKVKRTLEEQIKLSSEKFVAYRKISTAAQMHFTLTIIASF